MSMHDIDKKNYRRTNPRPNANDGVMDRLAHGTTQFQNSIEEAEADGLLTRERQIIAVQDGFEKAIFGFYGDANKFGFKIAEDGVNVTDATDDQLIFNSENNVFKIVDEIVLENTISHPTGGVGQGYQLVTYPHGLTEKPGYIAFFDLPSGLASRYGSAIENTPNPGIFNVYSGGGAIVTEVILKITADENNINFEVNLASSVPNATYTFYSTIYILRETSSAS